MYPQLDLVAASVAEDASEQELDRYLHVQR
jgi:hypothetical protein